MQKKCLILALFVVSIAAPRIEAANISFLVIETGLSMEGAAHQYSILLENELMDVFFEYGHIVTNSPIVRLPEKPLEDFPYEVERDFDNAKDGGMQYFLVAVVEYPAPNNVTLSVFDTQTGKLVQKHVYENKNSRMGKDESNVIKDIIGALAIQLY